MKVSEILRLFQAPTPVSGKTAGISTLRQDIFLQKKQENIL
jgi:hypothetical protein